MGNKGFEGGDALGRFILTLQSALTVDEVQSAFHTEAADILHAPGMGLYDFDPETGGVCVKRDTVSERLLRAYENFGRVDDPVLDFIVEYHRPIDSSRVSPASQWGVSGARTALSVDGFAHSLQAPILVGGMLFGTINFARPLGYAPFDDKDLIAARHVSEHLGLATERALRFEATGRRVSVLETTMDRVPQAMVVTDLDAQVLFRNRAARQVQGVGALSLSAQGAVQETIASAMEEFRQKGTRLHTSSIRDKNSGKQLIIRSYRLVDKDAAATLVYECGDESSGALPVLDVLSPREQEIAEFVSRGLSTKQIADQAFVSENTVKQHLKRIFAKTDVRNRAGLVQLIWAAGKQRDPGESAR